MASRSSPTGGGDTAMDAGVPDYGAPRGDDAGALSRDRVPVRTLRADDLDDIVRIDRRITGRDRRDYLSGKVAEALDDSGIRLSLVAETDGRATGFVMARVDFGDFGRTEPTAVIDTVGVDPERRHQGIGTALLSQLLANLNALRVDGARTLVRWNDFALLSFLEDHGFHPADRMVFTRYID